MAARRTKRQRNDKPSSENWGFEKVPDEDNYEEDDSEDLEDEDSEPLIEPLEVGLLHKQTDKYFAVRNKLSFEIAFYLPQDGQFLAAVLEARKSEKLPELNRYEDGRTYFDINKKRWVRESQFYASILEDSRNKIERRINEFIDRYRLPTVFHDWFLEWLLYNMSPRWTPVFNFELLIDVFENPKHILRLGLTTGEKRFVRAGVKEQLGIRRGRPPKKHTKILKRVENLLAKSKSPIRTFPSLNASLIIEGQKGLLNKWYDPEGDAGQTERKQKFTYAQVVSEIYSHSSIKQYEQRVMRARKYMERLKKRKGKLLGNK